MTRPLKNDLTGMRFGMLTVQGSVLVNNRTRWICQCDCGGMTIAESSNLVYGNVRSCGCYRKKRLHDLKAKEAPIGTRYGRLVVQGYDGPYAMVKCDCGAEKRVRNKHLLDGSTRSCGCLRRETMIAYNTSHKNN